MFRYLQYNRDQDDGGLTDTELGPMGDTPDEGPDDDSTTGARETPVTIQRNDITAIGRVARRRKLHPYQITEAEKLVTVRSHPPSSNKLLTCLYETEPSFYATCSSFYRAQGTCKPDGYSSPEPTTIHN